MDSCDGQLSKLFSCCEINWWVVRTKTRLNKDGRLEIELDFLFSVLS